MKTRLLVLLSFVAIRCFALTETVDGITWRYSVSNGEAAIGLAAIPPETAGQIVVPSVLGGYPLTSIGDSTFSSCNKLTSVTIPDSVTSIGDWVFSFCSELTSVTIGNGVTNIGNGTFAGLSGLTSVTMGNNLISIGKQAFSSCSGLTSLTIPNSVTSIGEQAFSMCSGLTSLTIPNSVTNISESAFSCCSGLTSLTIPNSVTSIGESAFSNCDGLRSITMGDNVTSIGKKAFSYCSGLTSLTIPDSVTSIGERAFDWCNGLTSLTIPDSVTSIGADALCCLNLETIYLPSRFAGSSLGIQSTCSVIYYNIVSLVVSSSHGTPTPPVGNHSFKSIDSVKCRTSPFESVSGNPSVRYACSGWSGTGSVPASGAGTNVTFGIRQNSTLTWNWRKENAITVSVTRGGSCDFGTQWIADGTTATATIVPNTHLYAVSLSGDTAGVSVSGTTISIPSDGPREISVAIDEVQLSLDVASEHGMATPSVGRTKWSWGNQIAASVTEPVPENGIREICYGWTGTGSVPRQGTGKSVSFCIEEDSSLTWNWRRDNQISVSVVGYGESSFGTRWIENGTTATAVIVPTMHLFTVAMSGDTNDVTLAGTTLTIPSDGPRDILVTVTETKLTLDVATAHGTTTPTGCTEWSWGETVSASVAADAPANGIRYVCTGWTGTGSVPASGTGTNVTFTIEEDSALAWNWQRENQICVSVTGCGECNFGAQWTPDGTTTTAAIIPTTHLYTISMSGDTNDVTLAGTTLTIPSDGPRNILVTVTETKLTLDVATAHGTATPTGCAEWSWGETVSASVAADAPANGIRYVCTGWTGTGSVPASGTGTNVTFTIEEDSSIVWNWATNVWIDCSATGFASIAFEPCWTNFGETVVIPFEPKDIGFSWTATGDTDDIVVDATARTISVPADQPRTIRIAFSGTARADAASGGGKPVEWTHGGDAEWFVDFADENDESGFLRSEEIGCGSNSWTEISVTGPGRLDFDWRVSCNSRGHYAQVLVGETQWKRITGTTDWASETIEIGEGNHRIRWNYVKGTTSPAGEDRACLDNVVWRPYVTLEVASGIDRCEPTVGEYRRLWGDELVMSAEPAVIHTNERVVCTGWTGTGSAPTTGTGTIAAFTITEDSTLQWNWGREVWIELAAEGPVQIAFTNGWIAQGSSNEVIVAETADYISWSMMVEDLETSDLYGLGAFSGWTNGPNAISPDKESSVLVDTNSVHAVRFDTESGRLSFVCHSGCRIALVADEMTLATALDTHGLVWASEGNGKWFPQVAVSSDDEDAAKSGTVQGDDASVLRTTFTGPGTLSWTWKLSMVGIAGVDVFLDDAPVDGLYDACDWTDHALEITGAGEHEVRFEFWNAGDAETITDCAYLDRMKWNGGMFEGMTETTPVPVPYEWLNGYPDLLDLFLHDYEATAWSGAANGANEVWQCYVAGLDPTSAASRLVATIDMVDGEPVVRWTPDLNEGGTKAERVYTVEGKTNLGDGSWGPTNEATRFFRVKVGIP